MSPVQLDIIINGAFIYQRADGSRYASFDYKLQEYGVPMVGRSGALTDADLQCTRDELLSRINATIDRKSWLGRVKEFVRSMTAHLTDLERLSGGERL